MTSWAANEARYYWHFASCQREEGLTGAKGLRCCTLATSWLQLGIVALTREVHDFFSLAHLIMSIAEACTMLML